MKNLIDSLGITHRRFAEQFNIPYRTVASWYTGERTAPEWVKSLIEEIIELKKNGKQLTIPNEKLFIIEYKTIYDRSETNSYSCYEKEYERQRAIKCFFDRTENYKTIKVYEVDKTPI